MNKSLFGKSVLAGLVVLLVVVFAGSPVFARDLEQIRAAIKEKGARWAAGETSVSKLPDQERKMRLGHVRHRLTGDEPLLASGPAQAGGAAAAYASYDWSYPTSYVTPVRDQGNCGSCWAFATAAALESYTLITLHRPGQDIDLSEQVMVSCGGAGSCGGGYVGSASNFLRDKGLPSEDCYCYTATNGTCSTACYNWQANSYKIAGWGYVATAAPTVEAIKNALVTYGPLVTTFDVYSDFFSYVSGVYRHVTGTYQGGHAVLIVGYDDANQCFRVKNSWGTGWGEAGYFRIAYSEVTSVVGFGESTIAYYQPVTPPPPSPPAPPPTPTCTYSVSPASKTFQWKGGTGGVTVTTGAGCGWTASTGAAWVTLSSPASRTGSGTAYYSVALNFGTTRTATIGITATGSSSAVGSASIIEKGRK